MTTKEFIQYINDRPELCEKLAACAAPDEVYAVAKAEGLTDSMEEFIAQVNQMKESMQMSDKDLDKVSAAGTTTVATVAAGTAAVTFVTLTAMAI